MEEENEVVDCETTSLNSSSVLSLLNDFRKAGEVCDVKLVVEGGTERLAHRSVLATFSPYFKAMFLGEFLESKKSEVELSAGLDASTIDLILEYAYGAKIEITAGSAENILHAAHFFQVEELIETCSSFMERTISAKRWYFLVGLSEVYNRPSFKEKAMEMALENFVAISQEVEFLELDSDTLISILSNDALNVEKEDYVLEAVQRWYYFKEEVRVDELSKVLSHVRMVHINPKSLKELIDGFPAMRSPSCMGLVNETLFYRLTSEQDGKKEPAITTITTRKRDVYMENVHVWMVFGTSLNTKKKELICINENMKIVLQIPTPPIDIRSCHTSGTELYSLPVDGECIYKYDFSLKRWHRIAQMSSARKQYGFAELDGLWYAIGGFLADTVDAVAVSIVERYDPKADLWISVPSLPIALNTVCVTSGLGCLFVTGLADDHDPSVINIFRYNPATNQWTYLTHFSSMVKFSVPRIHLLRDYLFIYGIFSDPNCHVYRLRKDSIQFIVGQEDFAYSFAAFGDSSTYVCTSAHRQHWYKIQKVELSERDISTKHLATFRDFFPKSIHLLKIKAGGLLHHRMLKKLDEPVCFLVK